MRRLFLLSLAALAITGCDGEKRQQSFINGLSERKAKAEEVIRAGQYSTDKLLVVQEYFFDFAEKVHMMRDDANVAEGVKAFVSKVGYSKFCADFLLPKSSWKRLNDHCSGESVYACSFEIREFQRISEQFKNLLGDEIKNGISQSCDF